MYTVANQRTIKTSKEACSKKKTENFTATNLIALKEAMSNLSGNAFKMWMYFSKNQNNYTFALSKVDTLSWCGFSKNTYTAAFNELVKKRYLIQSETNDKHYDFYEVARKEPPVEPTITIHKEQESKEFVF